jgi:cytoskeletal protein CcmA (bactofilin family)
MKGQPFFLDYFGRTTMFGRKEEPEVQPQTLADTTTTQSPVATRVSTPVAAQAAAVGVGGRPNHATTRRLSERTGGTDRVLTVGKGLSLSGEISACDSLIVEGKVDAKLSDGKLLEITESGQFRGTVEIESADIAGRYDGQLTVHGRLTVRSTGRISGMVCYGELEVNAGGQIIGETQVVGEAKVTGQNGGKGFKTAAKFTSLIEEEDDAANRRVVVGS